MKHLKLKIYTYADPECFGVDDLVVIATAREEAHDLVRDELSEGLTPEVAFVREDEIEHGKVFRFGH